MLEGAKGPPRIKYFRKNGCFQPFLAFCCGKMRRLSASRKIPEGLFRQAGKCLRRKPQAFFRLSKNYAFVSNDRGAGVLEGAKGPPRIKYFRKNGCFQPFLAFCCGKMRRLSACRKIPEGLFRQAERSPAWSDFSQTVKNRLRHSEPVYALAWESAFYSENRLISVFCAAFIRIAAPVTSVTDAQ